MMIWMSRLVSIALMCTLATARTPHARNYHPRTNSIDVKATSATDLDESWIPRRRALKRTKEKESSSGDLGEIFDESNEEQEDKAWTVNIEISITTDSPTISPTHTPTISPTHTPTISPTNYPTGSPTPKPSPTPTKEPTGVPTLFPTPIPQKITTLSCQSIDPSSSADVNNENVTIYFTYIVETNSTTIDESVEQTIIDELGSSISSSIVEDHCAGSRLLLRITNHRRLEITGVTSKPQDIKTGTCTPEKSESKSCTTFQGAVTILYTKEGNNKTPQEIDKNALDTIQENMNNGKYMKDVNEGLVGTKVNVTDIVYTNADTVPLVAVAEADEGAHHSRTYITPGGRTAIAFFVLVFIIINLLWCFCCKKKRGASSSPEHEQKGDSKSVSTGSGTHDDSAEEENSYITSDYNDLGKHHSKIDVHRCQSVMCKTCRPVIPHDGPLATIDEDDQLQEDRYLTSQTPIPRESIEKKSVRFIRIPGPQTPVHDVRAGDSFEDASDLTSLDDSFFFEESIRKEFEDSIRKEGTRRPEHEYVGEI